MASESLVQEIIKGIQKPAGITRSTISNILGVKGAPSPKNILTGEDTYGADEFIRSIEGKTGLDLHAGSRGKEGTIDNVINFLAELGVDIGTDPTMLISAPASLAGKAALGAGFGALTADASDPLDLAKHTIGGALAMPLGAKGVQLAGKALGGVGDKLADTYYHATRPELARSAKKAGITSISEADKIAREALDTLKADKNELLGLKEGFISDVGEDYATKAMEFADPYFADFTKRRNILEEQLLKKKNADKLAEFTVAKKKFKPSDAITSIDQHELNGLTGMLNTSIGKEVTDKLATIGDPKLTDAVLKFKNLNKKQIDLYNAHWAGKNGAKHINILPIDFHTFEVTGKDDIRKLISEGRYDLTQEGLYKRTKEGAIQTHGLSGSERLDLQSQSFINNYLDRDARIAKRYVDAVLSTDATDAMKGFETALEKYDGMLSFIKQQHLTFSHSWVVNNFTENLLRSYMDGGAGAAWGTLMYQGDALLGKSQSKLMQDILTITDPKNAGKFVDIKEPLAQVAFNHGVVDKGFFSEAFAEKNMSPAMLKVTKGAEDASKITKFREKYKPLVEGKETWDDFLRNSVGKTGQAIEGSARMATFENHINSMLSPSADKILLNTYGIEGDHARKIIEKVGYNEATKVLPQLNKVYADAGKVVNDAFFNYQNISLFEQKFMKRIIPYWTFFSKSIPYWAEQVATQPARLAGVMKVPANLGSEPTDKDIAGMPEYMKQQLGRPVSRDQKGTKFRSMPNISMFDALNFSEGEGDVLQKVSPILKVTHQLLANKDQFGNDLYPSTTKEQSTAMFGPQTKYGLAGVGFKDKQGRMRTGSDIAQILMTLQSNLLPLNAIDTLANAISDVKAKRLSPVEAITNLGPVKTKLITRDRQAQVINRNKRAVTEDKNKAKKRAEIDRLLELEN